MRKMKDSGIEWIGEIPEEWETVPLKSQFNFGKGLPITKENLIEKGIPVISYGQIHSKSNDGVHITDDLIRFVDEQYIQSNPLSLVNKFSFIFADTSEDLEGCGNCVYFDSDYQLFAGYHTIILQSQNNKSNKYLAYLFKSDAWRKQIREQVSGVKLFSISQKILKSVSVIIPPISEQQKIAAFLDRKCSEIDSVTAKTKATIEEYKKLKQAIITQAVTKGIRKGRKMKDSGVEWIGEIPDNWIMKRGKAIFIETNNRSINGTEELLTVSQYTGITPRSQKNVNMFEAETLEGYKICNVGDIAANTMWLWAGAIGVSSYFGVISPSYNLYRQKMKTYDDSFLDRLLRIKPLVNHYESLSTGIRASRLRLYPEQFLNIYFPVPPFEEQQEIAAYLDEKCSAIDTLIAKKEQLLTELESYKKSVIYEYVTGKKEV